MLKNQRKQISVSLSQINKKLVNIDPYSENYNFHKNLKINFQRVINHVRIPIPGNTKTHMTIRCAVQTNLFQTQSLAAQTVTTGQFIANMITAMTSMKRLLVSSFYIFLNSLKILVSVYFYRHFDQNDILRISAQLSIAARENNRQQEIVFPQSSKFTTHLICSTKSKLYFFKPVKPRMIIFPGTPALKN